jgi:hypothetical protein
MRDKNTYRYRNDPVKKKERQTERQRKRDRQKRETDRKERQTEKRDRQKRETDRKERQTEKREKRDRQKRVKRVYFPGLYRIFGGFFRGPFNENFPDVYQGFRY